MQLLAPGPNTDSYSGLILPEEELDIRKPTLNLAIGPWCPVRCEDCYNLFGDTAKNGGLITGDEVLDFAAAAGEAGVGRAIISGGDPLSHPDILKVSAGLHDQDGLGWFTRLDAVGTSFLDPDEAAGPGPRIIFKGKGFMPLHNPADFTDHVSRIHIPLDGASQRTAQAFRKGRPNSFEEAFIIADKISAAAIPLGIHSVANQVNIGEFPEMYQLIANRTAATEWRVFQFDPTGPNPSGHSERLALGPGQFEAMTASMDEHIVASRGLRVMFGKLGTAEERARGIYFMVNDGGFAYMRRPGQLEVEQLGHITRDRNLVMGGVRTYVEYYNGFKGGYTTK
jgi:MoaA/NifB/PqqE/SkfB family radical SAM enzyme